MKKILLPFAFCIAPFLAQGAYVCEKCYTSCKPGYVLLGCECKSACSTGNYLEGSTLECKSCAPGYFCPVGSATQYGCLKGSGSCASVGNCTAHEGTETDCNHRCPAGGHSDAGKGLATDCMIKSGAVFTGASGNFSIPSNVNYKK